MHLTNNQFQILQWLNDYRFLTATQLQRLSVAHIKTIHKAIRGLYKRDKPLISFAEIEVTPQFGRLPRLHYLTRYGAKYLSEFYKVDLCEINYPKEEVSSELHDYFHRVATIDLHILTRSFCDLYPEITMDFFQSYFRYSGANHWGDPSKPKRQALTKIKIDKKLSLIPDCVFCITDPQRKPFLFVGEVYRGHDTKRTFKQLCKYLHAIEKKSINEAYHYKRGIVVLIYCEQKNAMEALMQRVREDEVFQHLEEHFLFKTYEGEEDTPKTLQQVQNAFALGWQTCKGNKRGLFR